MLVACTLALELVGLLVRFACLASSKSPVVLDRVRVLPSLLLTPGLSGGTPFMAEVLALPYKREAYGSGKGTISRARGLISTGILPSSAI